MQMIEDLIIFEIESQLNNGTVECCVLYPCCVGVFGIVAVM